jgi:branched-chain amino acid transport system ATP-binding protein
MTSLLDVRNLRAFYGRTAALHSITFQMDEGSVTALLRANGAGKTTTLRAISGMIKRSGEIVLRGCSLMKSQTEDIVRLGVAHVPDGRCTFAKQTVPPKRIGCGRRRFRLEKRRRLAQSWPDRGFHLEILGEAENCEGKSCLGSARTAR